MKKVRLVLITLRWGQYQQDILLTIIYYRLMSMYNYITENSSIKKFLYNKVSCSSKGNQLYLI